MNIVIFLFSYLCFFLTGWGPQLSSHIKSPNFEQNSIHYEDESRWVAFDQRVSSQKLSGTPPRGWNSYNANSWTISEEEFLQNAEIISKKLLPHGYEYVVVDYLWYRRNVTGASVDSLGFDVIDEWGRPMPDPDRCPSSKGGKGFTEVADRVHKMGLKFGINVMRGINAQAVNANTQILDPLLVRNVYDYFNGKIWTAQDIGIKERTCARMQNGFMSVNTTLQAGRFFLADLYQQFANWGVDFVKQDFVFGKDLDMNEIYYASWLLRNQRPILYSVSPGIGATLVMAKSISGVVNMYSITGDDWEDVVARFDVARDFAAANMIGANSSWPDLDMLPLGWLSDAGSNEGPHRTINLILEELRTLMTLGCMARSPLMFGGDVRKLDDTTYSLLTNPTLLEINSFSSNNKEFQYIKSEGLRSWVATGRQGEICVAFFNLSSEKTTLTIRKSDLVKALPGTKLISGASCKGTEVWSRQDLGIIDHSKSIVVESHGTSLVVIHCNYVSAE